MLIIESLSIDVSRSWARCQYASKARITRSGTQGPLEHATQVMQPSNMCSALRRPLTNSTVAVPFKRWWHIHIASAKRDVGTDPPVVPSRCINCSISASRLIELFCGSCVPSSIIREQLEQRGGGTAGRSAGAQGEWPKRDFVEWVEGFGGSGAESVGQRVGAGALEDFSSKNLLTRNYVKLISRLALISRLREIHAKSISRNYA